MAKPETTWERSIVQVAEESIATQPWFVPAHVPSELVKPFDLFGDPGMASCPHAAAVKVREHGRVFWNPTNTMFAGSWVLTRAADLRTVLSQPHLFSNKGETGFLKAIGGDDWDMIPLELDPPRHTKFRQLLNPVLAPPAVARLADGITARAVKLIEAVRPNGGCDFIAAFANPLPISIFMQLMGLPAEDADRLVEIEAGLLHTGDIVRIRAAAAELDDYLMGIADARRAAPVDDLTSYIVQAEVDGQPLTRSEIKGILYLLFLAGLDTVGSTMSFIFHHLAEQQDQQHYLRENPDRIPQALEELIRRYSIITSHRQCKADVEVAGVQMKAGDWVSIMTMLGSTDPEEFDDPMDVRFDRKTPRHFGFNFGPHFCMGSHLARQELKTALGEWLARVPMWRLKPGGENRTHGGHTFGFERLELEW